MDAAELVDQLKDREDVSEYARAYEWMKSELAVQCNHFIHDEDDEDEEVKGELFGMVKGEYTYIYKAAFDRMCEKGNISPRGFLSWAKSRDLIRTDKDHFTKNVRIGNNALNRCVCLKTDDESAFAEADDDDLKSLPFT